MKRWMLALTACCLLAADSGSGAVVKPDKDLLQGKWKVVALDYEGKKAEFSDEALNLIKLVIQKDQFVLEFPPGDVFGSTVVTRRECTFVLDETKKPKELDLTVTSEDGKGMKALGIYILEGKRLKICLCHNGKTRPSDFTTMPNSACSLLVYERE